MSRKAARSGIIVDAPKFAFPVRSSDKAVKAGHRTLRYCKTLVLCTRSNFAMASRRPDLYCGRNGRAQWCGVLNRVEVALMSELSRRAPAADHPMGAELS